MNRHDYFSITSFQYRIKDLERQLALFKSGEKYLRMEQDLKKEVRAHNADIKKLKKEVEEAHRATRLTREYWFQSNDDLENEYEKRIRSMEKMLEKLEKRALKAERQRDDALDLVTELRGKIRDLEGSLEEEKEKNQNLRAQIRRDFETSSLPSSRDVNHKKISNNRQKTGRKPGAQPGHPWHGRKKHTPTSVVQLPPPKELLEDPDFKPTGRVITKQVVNLRVVLDVTEYRADVFYNSKTGERRHAKFPKGVVDDVNYGGSVKAFLYLLNNDCCTSIDKSRKFLSDLTAGRLKISKGMINKLGHQFADKSKKDLQKVFADMLLSPVMHIDNTNARYNGKGAFVFICATPGGPALYFARETKGHKGVRGTVAEKYYGTLVGDHDTTWYSYGSQHQECNAHILRYLKDSIVNEPHLTWNSEMHKLIREMIHYRKSIPEDGSIDQKKVEELEKRYDRVLQKAATEYEEHPARYYRDGYNLSLRMGKYKENHLLFLHDLKVPWTNNEAERGLRKYKRKQVQAISFRSFQSMEDLCDGMSMLYLLRHDDEENLFSKVSEIFER